MKLMIPVAFQDKYPVLAKSILTKCKTQAEADVYLAKFIPGYRTGYDPESREARRLREYNHEAQAAGSYSLHACEGGAYMHATPPGQHKFRTVLPMGERAPTITRVVATITAP